MWEAGKYLLVFITGAAGIWKGVPLGLGLNIHPFFTGILTALGSITTILVIYFAGDSVRQWIIRKYGSKKIEKNKSKFIKLLDRFGVPVLGVIAPGLLGPVIPLLMGLIFIKSTRRFLFYLLAGIILWSFVLAYLFTPIFELGSKFFNQA